MQQSHCHFLPSEWHLYDIMVTSLYKMMGQIHSQVDIIEVSEWEFRLEYGGMTLLKQVTYSKVGSMVA